MTRRHHVGGARFDDRCGVVSARGKQRGRRSRDDELLARLQRRLRRQVVRLGQVRAVHFQLLGNRRDRLTLLHRVMVEGNEFFGAGARHASEDEIRRSVRNLQLVVGCADWRGPPPQLRVEVLDVLDRHADPLSHATDVHRAVERNPLEGRRGVHRRDRQAVLDRVARDDDRREDQRNVVARLAGQVLRGRGQLPEIVPARTLDGALHASLPAVV